MTTTEVDDRGARRKKKGRSDAERAEERRRSEREPRDAPVAAPRGSGWGVRFALEARARCSSAAATSKARAKGR